MKSDTLLSEEKLICQATEVLLDKFGILDTTRFLALKQQGRLDSVIRHQEWQTNLDKEQFFTRVFKT
jgi:hypothetical protein